MENIKKQLKELLDQATILAGKKTNEEIAEYLAESNVVQMISETTGQNWISVNDRMPHSIGGDSDDVITLNRFGEYNILYYDGKIWRKRNGEPYKETPAFEVIAWMIPSTPQGFKPWRRSGDAE